MAKKSTPITAEYKCIKDCTVYQYAGTNYSPVQYINKGTTVYADKKGNEYIRLFVYKNGITPDSSDAAKTDSHKKVGWAKESNFEFVKNLPHFVDVVNTNDESEKKKDATTVKIKKDQSVSYKNKPAMDSFSKVKDREKIKIEGRDLTPAQQRDMDTLHYTDSAGVIFKDNQKHIANTIENYGLVIGPEDAKDKYFNKFSRVNFNDPYYTMTNGVKEYLFFTRPDLNLIDVDNRQLVNELATDSFFVDLVRNHPDTVDMLQYSYNKLPFNQLLSACVASNLELPNIEAESMEGPRNIYGTSIKYRQDGYSSDEDYSFSLEFRETGNQDIYYYFKAFEMYEQAKKLGKVGPRNNNFITNKILHDQIGVYKIVVGEDMQTITFMAYLPGVYPLTVPRSAYSTPNPQAFVNYSIDFHAAFIEDMKPIMMRDFNILQKAHKKAYSANTLINPYDTYNIMVNGEWAHACQIRQITNGVRDKFILEWYKA